MADDSPKQETPPEKPDNDLAGDWESAFQAEDFMFAPKEGEDDFFLGDDADFTTGTSSPYEFTPPSAKELAELPDLDEAAVSETAGTTSAVSETAAVGTIAGISSLLATLASLYHTAKLRLQLLPRPQQILAACAAVAIIGLLAALLFHSGTEETKPVGQPTAVGQPPATAGTAGALPVAPPPATEQVRTKWSFPSFLIPSPPSRDGTGKISFVEVDLTLILLMNAGEPVPQEKELLVRDIIYQFYSNQPGEELRRYALARGDMNRNLRAWLHKQWPEAPIEAIVFDRYHIL
ncbi:MAG: flagellar basal body-associated FliL family protein [Desulfobulbaceae bacterium]|nr:flagellar basal body-associated FliL family protein [Desulfobulbaceae bacterium]